MNQLFYNIAAGTVHQIRSEKRTTTSEVIARGERNKQNRNWLYFNFSVESSSFIFNNLKTEKSQLTFKGWNRPVCDSFGFTSVFLSKFVAFHPWTSGSEANRDGADAESPFPLFSPFSASFKSSSSREKVGKLCSFWDWWAESLYPLLSRNIIFCPALTMAASAKKNFWRSDLLKAISVHYQDFKHA